MSDQIQRDDGEWQMLLNNAYSMVESLTNRVEARDAQIESLEKFRYDAKVENAELHSQIESLQGERDEARAWAAKYRCAVSPEQQETFPWENTGGEE